MSALTCLEPAARNQTQSIFGLFLGFTIIDGNSSDRFRGLRIEYNENRGCHRLVTGFFRRLTVSDKDFSD